MCHTAPLARPASKGWRRSGAVVDDVQVVLAQVLDAQEVPVQPLPVNGYPIQVPPCQAVRLTVCPSLISARTPRKRRACSPS